MKHLVQGRIIFAGMVFCLLALSCGLKSAPKNEEEFCREISRLYQITQSSPDQSARAEAHLKLARIYLYHENPFLDYRRALQELEAYLTLAPENENEKDTQDWLSVLHRVEKLEDEHQQMESRVKILDAENTTRKENLDQQTQIIQELKDKVEGLTLENGARKEALEQQRKKSQKLQNDVESLQTSNGEFKEMIERLKKLDREMEEKRKNLQY